MKITREYLANLIKEELEKEAYNPRTFDSSGEYAGRGPAGADTMDDYRSEQGNDDRQAISFLIKKIKASGKSDDMTERILKNAESILKDKHAFFSDVSEARWFLVNHAKKLGI